MNMAFSQHLIEQCRGLLAGVRAADVRDQLEVGSLNWKPTPKSGRTRQ